MELNIEQVPECFRPIINTVYPPNNTMEFERWAYMNYLGANTDRTYLPILWTAYHVNNGYGQDERAIQELQEYVDGLDRSEKYWTVVQYDDSVLIDFKGLDVIRFEMSKKGFVDLPLIGQEHPYKFFNKKKWMASFVGSMTHQIREHVKSLSSSDGYYISFEHKDAETYCRVLNESIFSLCPRGYGVNSFRIAESMLYGAIPVYISDEFMTPFGIDFEQFGVLIKQEDVGRIDEILCSIEPEEIIKKQDHIQSYYDKYYTYEGVFKQIKNTLATEYHKRKGE